MKQHTRSIGDTLQELLKRYKLENNYAEYALKEKWSQLVGRQLALVTEPLDLKADMLTIRVTDEHWFKELNKKKTELLAMLNENNAGITINKLHIVS